MTEIDPDSLEVNKELIAKIASIGGYSSNELSAEIVVWSDGGEVHSRVEIELERHRFGELEDLMDKLNEDLQCGSRIESVFKDGKLVIYDAHPIKTRV